MCEGGRQAGRRGGTRPTGRLRGGRGRGRASCLRGRRRRPSPRSVTDGGRQRIPSVRGGLSSPLPAVWARGAGDTNRGVCVFFASFYMREVDPHPHPGWLVGRGALPSSPPPQPSAKADHRACFAWAPPRLSPADRGGGAHPVGDAALAGRGRDRRPFPCLPPHAPLLIIPFHTCLVNPALGAGTGYSPSPLFI